MIFFVKSKKQIFASLFLIFLIVTSLFSTFIFFLKEKSDSSVQVIKSIKSPCRGVVSKVNFKSQKKILFSKRVERLNQLMETPIDWVFKDIKGEVFDLYCYRKKKKIIINLWATWCAPCIEELSSLSALAEKNSKDMFVVAVTTESLEVVNSFIKRSFSDLSGHLKIVKVSPEELSKYFFVDSLPVTYLFNRDGKLDSKVLGARDWLDMKL